MGILMGICIDVILKNITYEEYIEIAHAEEIEKPKSVRLEVIYNWTEERIEQEIRTVFWEDPETAVKIAKCESGLRPAVQSKHILSYGQERSFGIFQIHAPDWHTTAIRLGYNDYQTDVLDNLHMARYIYDQRGKMWLDWTCYTKKMI